MSDVSWCQKCVTYHASLTACPLPLSTDCISPTYQQTGTTTVDLDGMRAEIARLKAERDEWKTRAEKAEALCEKQSRDWYESVSNDYDHDPPIWAFRLADNQMAERAALAGKE